MCDGTTKTCDRKNAPGASLARRAATRALRGGAKARGLCSPPCSDRGRAMVVGAGGLLPFPLIFTALFLHVGLASSWPFGVPAPRRAAAPAAQAPGRLVHWSCGGLADAGAESLSGGDSSRGPAGMQRCCPARPRRCLLPCGAGVLQWVEQKALTVVTLAGTGLLSSCGGMFCFLE